MYIFVVSRSFIHILIGALYVLFSHCTNIKILFDENLHTECVYRLFGDDASVIQKALISRHMRL